MTKIAVQFGMTVPEKQPAIAMCSASTGEEVLKVLRTAFKEMMKVVLNSVGAYIIIRKLGERPSVACGE